MTVQSVTRQISTGIDRPRQTRSTRADAEELKSDAQMLAAAGVAAAAMIGIAHAEVAAMLTAGLTALATVPLRLRARSVERSVARSRAPHDPERL